MRSQVGGTPTESWLGVPILAGDRVIGVVALESLERDAYTEADERLLSTLASSMGVALENARLFDETKRLLAETDQRAAELAVINEIGTALAKQLDFEAIIELVGERVALDLRQPARCSIALYDEATRIDHVPVRASTRASAFDRSDLELGPGLTSTVIRHGSTAAARERSDDQVAAGGDPGWRQ